MPARTRAVAGALTALLLCVRMGSAAEMQGQDTAGVARPLLIDVPFVPQSALLCGGAAVAMVLRYWRDIPVHAEDFSSLATDDAAGIAVGELVRAVEALGWHALPFVGTPRSVQHHLSLGRPVIVLIEDRPGRHHYVVVVGWGPDRVVTHDPVRGPFRMTEPAEFEAAWRVADNTAILVLPDRDSTTGAHDVDAPGRPNAVPIDHCGAIVDEAVRLARAGARAEAERLLLEVRETCPSSSGGPRELAGLRFVERRWEDAADLATEAVRRDRRDLHAWQLLAASRFLQGDVERALDAWNWRDEPRIDLAAVRGLDRVHYDVVDAALSLPRGDLLTAANLRRAARRVAEVPALAASHVTYSARADGRATVEAAVLERPLIPRSWTDAAGLGIRAAALREVRADIASPSGNGELWTATWRWAPERPRAWLSLATPGLAPLPGFLRLDAGWERERHGGVPESDGTVHRNRSSERRHVGLSLADWSSGSIRWEVGVALDDWRGSGRYLAGGVGLEKRSGRDSLAVRMDARQWIGIDPAPAFARSRIALAWRSEPANAARWTVVAGMEHATSTTPLLLWPAAGAGHARAATLRAHPLVDDGVIRAAALARMLTYSTIEYRRTLTHHWGSQLGWAGFLDIASRRDAATRRALAIDADVGVGLRARLASTSGALRLDVARGLRDGRTALSVGWEAEWPGWEALQ